MSLQLAIWEGEVPQSPWDARDIYQRLDTHGERGDITAHLRGFVTELQQYWPHEEGSTLWKKWPLLGEASGNLALLELNFTERFNEVMRVVKQLARDYNVTVYLPGEKQLIHTPKQRDGDALPVA